MKTISAKLVLNSKRIVQLSLLIAATFILTTNFSFSQHGRLLNFGDQALLGQADFESILSGAESNPDILNRLIQIATATAARYNISEDHPHYNIMLQAIAVGLRDRSIAMDRTFFMPANTGSAFSRSLRDQARSYVEQHVGRRRNTYPTRQQAGEMTRRWGNDRNSDGWRIARLGHRLGMELSNLILVQPDALDPQAAIGFPHITLMSPTHYEHQLIHLLSMPSAEHRQLNLSWFRQRESQHASEFANRRRFFEERYRIRNPSRDPNPPVDRYGHTYDPTRINGGG